MPTPAKGKYIPTRAPDYMVELKVCIPELRRMVKTALSILAMKFLSLAAGVALLSPLSAAAPLEARQSSSWFLPNLDHTSGAVRGFVPDLENSSGQSNFTYPVYEAVSPGDAQSFINALTNNGPSGGARDNCYLAGEPRMVYVPPGMFFTS